MRTQSVTSGPSPFAESRPEDPFGSPPAAGEAAESECRDLLDALRRVADPRKPRGIRYTLVSVLALAAAAVVAGARSYVAVGQWAAHAPAAVLARVSDDLEVCGVLLLVRQGVVGWLGV